MILEKKDIIEIYNKSKKSAFIAYKYKSFNKCLKYINISARIAYKFSWIFKDDDLESLLMKMSKSLFKLPLNYTPIENKFVFFDSIAIDNVGLSQQYIRSLMANNLKFLYISDSKRNVKSENILSEIETYNNAEIYFIPSELKRTEKAKILYEKIISYNPNKLLMHLMPYSVNALLAFYALPKEIIKYQINLTDHAFWLGTGCLDYTFEFRPYGCNLSQHQRGISKEKILLLPYYPIVNNNEFQGFPKECEGKVIIFSGGAYPKILGENNLFLNLVKKVLLANTNVCFLFAGSGDVKPIEKFITDNGLEKRFFLLGHRADINEVFKNCDIYMSTYPLGGGLMAQFAAVNGKAILSYSTVDKISTWPEETLCLSKKIKITHTDIDEFLSEAKKLVSNSDYRISKGDKLKECVVSIDRFNKNFINSITQNVNQIQYDDIDINVDLICKHNIDIENNNNEFKIDLFKFLKFGVLFLSPKIFIWAFTYIFTKSFIVKLSRRF